MALDQEIFETRTLREKLKKSKKKQMRFGFGKGKKADSHKLAIDEKLQPKKLFEFAKSNAETNAATYGLLDTDADNVLTVRYERKCDGLLKAFRQILKTLQYASWDLRLIGPDGEEELDPGVKDEEAPPDAAPTEDGGGGGAKVLAQLSALTERIKAAIQAQPKHKDAILKLSGRIKANAEKDEAETVQSAVEEFKKLVGILGKLAAAPAQGDGKGKGDSAAPAGIVEKRKFLITRWQQIPGEMKVEVDSLLAAVTAQAADEAPDDLCNAIHAALTAFIDEMRASINDALDEDINAGDPRYGKTTATIRQLKDGVRAHDLVKLLKKNPMTPGERFEAALIDALDEVGSKMAA